MSYLCYSLDEAAKQLGMSETVLFRLSQFLKIPASAYDDVGYIAFNGDLSFDDSDLSFFKQVKDRLLKGETLEAIKQRLRPSAATAKTTALAPYSPQANEQASYQHTETATGSGMKTVETVSHLKKEAAKTFNRYKLQTRPRINQVFHNIAQQLTDNIKQGISSLPVKPPSGTNASFGNLPHEPLWHPEAIYTPGHGQTETTTRAYKAAAPAAASHHQPTWPHQETNKQKETNAYTSNALPSHFSYQSEPEPQAETAESHPLLPEDSPWMDIIQTASQNPRALNVRLRAAAQTLRQKALSQIQQDQTSTL